MERGVWRQVGVTPAEKQSIPFPFPEYATVVQDIRRVIWVVDGPPVVGHVSVVLAGVQAALAIYVEAVLARGTLRASTAESHGAKVRTMAFVGVRGRAELRLAGKAVTHEAFFAGACERPDGERVAPLVGVGLQTNRLGVTR